LGHASFEIEVAGKLIYIDPYMKPPNPEVGDIILVSHDHFDHCDVDTINLLSDSSTLMVSPHKAGRKLGAKAKVVKEGDVVDLDDISVKAVHAYNTDEVRHPRGYGIGYIIEGEGKRIYFAGDTDHIPEMMMIDDIAVAILPVGGRHNMNVEEAIEAARVIQPELLIPMHYGHLTEDEVLDELYLKRRVESESNTRVEILTHGELHI